MVPYIDPFEINFNERINPIALKMCDDRNDMNQNNKDATFLKIMNSCLRNVDKPVDDEISLCSLTDDTIFSSVQSGFSLCSITSEEFSSDDGDSDLSLCSIDEDIFDAFMDTTSTIMPNNNKMAQNLTILPEIPPFTMPSCEASKEIDAPSAQSTLSPYLKLQNKKRTFDEHLTNLEISMRRTEMTRSVVLKQSKLFYGNSIRCSSKNNDSTFPCNNQPVVRQGGTNQVEAI